jgi:hypothetical protein
MFSDESDKKKIISRLVLQKVLSSTSVKWMKSSHFETISKSFLSQEPERETYIQYILKKPGVNENSYGNDIVTLSLKWIDSDGEILDPEGNVWKSTQLKISPSISSTYGDKEENFVPRVECMSEVRVLIGEIREMISGPIRTMILDNEGRVARDTKRKYDAMCDKIASRLKYENRDLRHNLRAGGRGRAASRGAFAGIEVGNYAVVVNDGSHRTPRYKKYSVVIPENPTYLVVIKRVE